MAEGARRKQLDITKDGKVVKTVLKEGAGPCPSLHATCIVHYVGRLRDNNEVFMDTSKEDGPSRIIAARDAVLQGSGLNLAVASMQVGEKARVDVAPQYGYGVKGNFSFPSIPPDADLVYEVELLGFDKVEEGRESSSMLFEERIEAAKRRKLEGNILFQNGEVLEAIGKYTMGLSYMDQDFMFQLEGQHEVIAQDVRCPILLNLAACQLQETDYQGACSSATQVLVARPKDAKALFRRGKARHALGQLDLAEEDLRAAQQEARSDTAIFKELKAVLQSKKAQQEGADDLFRGQLRPRLKRRVSFNIETFWQRWWRQFKEFLSSWFTQPQKFK